MAGIESLLTGHTLAERYRIEEVIGRGGMAAVYRATDERLGRDVAVKVIMDPAQDDDASARSRARFLREARAAAGIDHPNVIRVYDFGTDPANDLDFLVMELLHGADLATALADSGAPPVAAAVRILHDAALGLGAGHRLGLVHRDVKPGNLFLSPTVTADAPRVVVLDFGIAQIAEADQTVTHLTGGGRAPLSPGYASPEQLRGGAELTPASDVFSLGVIAFQLLTGERLFEGPRTDAPAEGADGPPRNRLRDRKLPPGVEAAVVRALDDDPAARFADANDFADALLAATTEQRVAAAPVTLTAPPRKSVRVPAGRRRVGPLAAILLLAVAAVAAAVWLLPRDDRTARGDAPLPTQAERPAPEPAAAVPAGEATTGADGVVPPVPQPDEATPPALPERAAPAPPSAVERPAQNAAPAPVPAGPEAGRQPAPVAAGNAGQHNTAGVRLLQQGDAAAATERLRQAVEIEPRNAEFRNNYGWALYQAGRAEDAERELRRVVELAPQRDIVYANLGDVRAARGDTAAAIAMYERFLTLNRDARRRQIAEQKLRQLRGEPR